MLKGMQTTVKSSMYAPFRAYCPVLASLFTVIPCMAIATSSQNLEVSRE